MNDPVKALKDRISAAKREIPADLVLRGGRVVNVFMGSIQESDVAVYDGMIVGLGSGYLGKTEWDLNGKWIVPGLIDGHLHIESSMLLPSKLAEALLIHGTTAVVSDPHEIANVTGIEGVRFMLSESDSIPFDIFFMAPSCVPATHLETAGATLMASDLAGLKAEPRILGLAEMMNFPGVLKGRSETLEKILLFENDVLDGHCPSLGSYDLQAYLSAGMLSDHESTSRPEALEKVEKGVMLMIREGSSARNLEELVPLVTDRNAHRFCFVSDDLHPEDIQGRGHLDFMIRKAIGLGLNPVTAVRLATLNPAQYFGLKRRGAIAPGYRADLAILNNLRRFEVLSVVKDGQVIVDNGKLIGFPVREQKGARIGQIPLNISPLNAQSFRISHLGSRARVIGLVPGQIFTRILFEELKSNEGWVISDVDTDILKLCVVERHKGSGRIGLGMVKGFGLREGAIASSVAHDSHNVIAVGVNDGDLYKAVDAVRQMGGGLAAVRGEEVIAKVPLQVAGLMSVQPLDTLVKDLSSLKHSVSVLGCALNEPFMTLSFLALPVIPELKLTDKGLVDVNRFEIVPLFVESR